MPSSHTTPHHLYCHLSSLWHPLFLQPLLFPNWSSSLTMPPPTFPSQSMCYSPFILSQTYLPNHYSNLFYISLITFLHHGSIPTPQYHHLFSLSSWSSHVSSLQQDTWLFYFSFSLQSIRPPLLNTKLQFSHRVLALRITWWPHLMPLSQKASSIPCKVVVIRKGILH